MEKVVDIVKVAVENEVKAKAFYTRAAQIASQGESQMVFLELTEMEDGHAKLLVDRFGPLLYADGTEPWPFLQRLEDMVVNMPAGEEFALIERGEMRLVIEFAIGMEARARDAYRALGAQLTDPDLQALCKDLAREEQKHHDILCTMRVSVDTAIEDRPAL